MHDRSIDDPDAAARLDRIRRLEELKSAVAAAQARETAAFAAAQRAKLSAAGRNEAVISRSIAAQVGLARRMSPWAAGRYVGWAAALVAELPRTFAELAAGRTTEWRAFLVARETTWLNREHRAVVDAQVAPRLEGLGDRMVEAEAKRIAYRLDPAGALARVHGAERDRRVTIRPAPDTMARLSCLAPVAQGVAAYAALSRAADSLIASGDSRTRGQLMADVLIERITGQAQATDVPVEVELVITPESLLGGGNEPANLIGYGPLPAGHARELVTAVTDATPVWIRRLFSAPAGTELVALETRRRCFTPAQRRFVRLRGDGFCRTPWCNAPLRHVDHVQPAADGGPTSIANAQGLCEACNYIKQEADDRCISAVA